MVVSGSDSNICCSSKREYVSIILKACYPSKSDSNICFSRSKSVLPLDCVPRRHHKILHFSSWIQYHLRTAYCIGKKFYWLVGLNLLMTAYHIPGRQKSVQTFFNLTWLWIHSWIGHFRIVLCLFFQARPQSCKTFHMKMSFICMWMETHCHMKGYAPRLTLKERYKATQKWPIDRVPRTAFSPKTVEMAGYSAVTPDLHRPVYWLTHNSDVMKLYEAFCSEDKSHTYLPEGFSLFSFMQNSQKRKKSWGSSTLNVSVSFFFISLSLWLFFAVKMTKNVVSVLVITQKANTWR